MYDIQEYSFGQTTLEQVYLKFAHYEDTDVFENITTWTKQVIQITFSSNTCIFKNLLLIDLSVKFIK